MNKSPTSALRVPLARRPMLAGDRPPRIPQEMRIYAVGDIHGRADLLGPLFHRIEADLAANPIARPIEVFLGDYVDRGPNSRQVIDMLIERRAAREAVCLRGNHETFAVDFLDDPGLLENWRRWGGLETLMSYGVLRPGLSEEELCNALNNAMPNEHVEFLATLPTTFDCGDFFFVHAGVRPGVELSAQREQDLIWIREEFLDADAEFGKVIVHGHTPVRDPDVRRNRINIDTGAYITGRLTCLIIEGDNLFFL